VHKKHAKNAVFFESDGEKGLKALKGEKGVPVPPQYDISSTYLVELCMLRLS
jgi:hypothetical protein